jgi:hypothetical protein
MHTFIQYSIIFLSLCFWFYIDSVKLVEKNLINSALIHGIICAAGIHIGYFFNPSIIYNYILVPELHDVYLIVPLISFGYSFYDLYIGIKSQKVDNLVHGILFVFCNSYLFMNNNIILTYTFLITETSSIFLNLRVYRKQWIDLLFVLTFFIYRILVAPIFLIIYLNEENNRNKIFSLIGAICLTILNLFWFRLIVNKIFKKVNTT